MIGFGSREGYLYLSSEHRFLCTYSAQLLKTLRTNNIKKS